MNTVTLPYNEADAIAFVGNEANLKLYHWDGTAWIDVTVLPVDTANNLITGEVTSLSHL